MRSWIIVSASAIGAIAVATALAIPDVVHASPLEIGPILLSHLPVLAVAALAVYALCAMLLATAAVVIAILRVHHYLARPSSDNVSAQRDWDSAFGANKLLKLATRLTPTLPRSTTADGSGVLQTGITASTMRAEIARLHYVSLARSHFFSALIVLAGVVGLGLARDHASLPLLSATIPTISAVLILVGLVLLAVLGRIAIDVTAEPLFETVSRLPTERVEVRLLRRAVELLERGRNLPAADDKPPASPIQSPERLAPERLVAAIEQGHHALLDAVGRLSANAQALEAAMQSSVETIERTMQTAAAQQQTIDSATAAGAAAFPELQTALEELTAVLQRLSAPTADAEATAAADPLSAPPRETPPPRLARELRRLLQEIDVPR